MHGVNDFSRMLTMERSRFRSLRLLVALHFLLVSVSAQSCLLCSKGLEEMCCSRHSLCCMGQTQNPHIAGVGSVDKPGQCPQDRFPDASVTICLRKVCGRDSDCFMNQKCCPFGKRKCCVYAA